MDEEPWFRPKRFGFGAGWPTAWQGWATILAFIAGMTAAVHLSGRNPILAAALAALSLFIFLLVVARRTRGGLRWRWGGDDR